MFSDLKSLYSLTKPEKQQIIQQLLETELNSIPDIEPSTYLWTLYYLAQHHSYLGDHAKALDILDQAIQHTPTLPDLLMFKGRVLKRCGDYLSAARSINEARLLDGQDRFLNTKTGKYLLRAGMVNEANGILGMFTKVRPPFHPVTFPEFRKLNIYHRKMQYPQVQIWKKCNHFSTFLRKVMLTG